MHYLNPTQSPLECVYEFPMDKDAIFSELVAKIDDAEIVTIISPRKKAVKAYERAVK